jgi:hypothetical protein
VVGFTRPNVDPCPASVSDVQCIKNETFDEAKIASFWGEGNITRSKLALTATYLMFMLGFAAAVGVVSYGEKK